MLDHARTLTRNRTRMHTLTRTRATEYMNNDTKETEEAATV